jgi:hypothetical protein
MFRGFIMGMLVFLNQLPCLTVDVSMHANTFFFTTLQLSLLLFKL